MTMKKKLAIVVCSVPFALAPLAYAQTGGTVEGTTSPQSGNQTDMGADGASNSGSTSGSGSSSSGSSSTGSSSGGASSNASSNGGTTNSNDTTSKQSSSAPESGASASGSSASSAGSTGGDSTTSGAPASSATSNPGAGNASGSTTPSGSDTTPAASSSSGSSATTGSSANADAASGESFDAKLKGKSVYNENDEKVGDVKDLVMSSDGKVTHVILGVGGFVGVGEHPVAIPFDEINTTGDKLTLRGYTKDKLKEMPAYEYPKEERSAAPAPATSGASPMGPR